MAVYFVYTNRNSHNQYKKIVQANEDIFEQQLKIKEQEKQLAADLSENEKNLAAFIKMDMKNKDISQITFQRVNAINVAKNRLRNKLNLETNEQLYDIILNL